MNFMERCAGIEGVAIGESVFSDGQALWLGTREIAHFDADGVLDVRLTNAVIRDRRAEFEADDRISLRGARSDWLEFRITTEVDADDAFTVVAHAVAANLPTAKPGLPPTGAELARRRRFH
jgi:hypothetical protein